MKIPGFDILDKLGEGGMAIVWKAYQVSLDRTVAIKILKPQFSRNPNEVKDFIFEARSAAKLRHPNIVQVYDVAEQGGTYYFVMEYVPGRTAKKLVEEQGPISPKLAVKIAKVVAEALDWAWRKNRLIHRDIKPDNIMIDDDGNIKVADLGLAKISDASGHMPANVQDWLLEGTPNYMSPEQARFNPRLDCKADMYSLGASLYHLMTGKIPFAGRDPADTLQMHVSGHLPNPRDINQSVTPGLAQFITRLMMKDPDDRYVDWSEVLADIKKVAAGRILMVPKLSDSTIESPRAKADAVSPAKNVRTPLPSWVPISAWAVILLWWMFIVLSELSLPQWSPRTVKTLTPPQTNSGNAQKIQGTLDGGSSGTTAPGAAPGTNGAN